MDDSIYALSSGTLPSGVAVIRISGPRAFPAIHALTGTDRRDRGMSLQTCRHPHGGAILDEALILRFPGPASFTGEDCAEIQAHGSNAVVRGLLSALSEMDGLRMAQPGEFTRRAFENGRIDLTQAEALSDLIAAETEAQRDQALSNSKGRLRDLAERWRDAILSAMAEIEAELDFSDEGDVGDDARMADLAPLIAEMRSALDTARIGERIRHGLTVTIIGPPNAGKSSLLNALARRDVAIVTPIAGTTRDLLEVHMDLAGVPVTLIDTAGLRSTSDIVEAEGIARARRSMEQSDLILDLGGSEPGAVRIINRIDETGQSPGARDGIIYISARTGAGIDALEAWLTHWARDQLVAGEPAIVTHERQRVHLTRALHAVSAANGVYDPVLRAEELRVAAQALSELTGRIDAEAVLGQIFSRFCIGK